MFIFYRTSIYTTNYLWNKFKVLNKYGRSGSNGFPKYCYRHYTSHTYYKRRDIIFRNREKVKPLFKHLFAHIRGSFSTTDPHKNCSNYSVTVTNIKAKFNNHVYIMRKTVATPRNVTPLSTIEFVNTEENNTVPISGKSLLHSQSKDRVYKAILSQLFKNVPNLVSVAYDKLNNSNLLSSKNEHESHLRGKENVVVLSERDDTFPIPENISSDKETNENASVVNVPETKRKTLYVDLNDKDWWESSENFDQVSGSRTDETKSNNTVENIKNSQAKFSGNLMIVKYPFLNKRTLFYFLNKNLYVLESTNFDNLGLIYDYMKEINYNKNNNNYSYRPGRINFINFEKVSFINSKQITNNTCSSEDVSEIIDSKNNNQPFMHLEKDTENNFVILKTESSICLETVNDKLWIPFKEESDNCALKPFEYLSGNECDINSDSIIKKHPIKKDKLIEDKVEPNKSILNIINSIDKSAVIIQKDLYITDRIIQKIKKDPKIEDKNKLDTKGFEELNQAFYLHVQLVDKNGKFVKSFYDFSKNLGIKRVHKSKEICNEESEPLNDAYINDNQCLVLLGKDKASKNLLNLKEDNRLVSFSTGENVKLKDTCPTDLINKAAAVVKKEGYLQQKQKQNTEEKNTEEIFLKKEKSHNEKEKSVSQGNANKNNFSQVEISENINKRTTEADPKTCIIFPNLSANDEPSLYAYDNINDMPKKNTNESLNSERTNQNELIVSDLNVPTTKSFVKEILNKNDFADNLQNEYLSIPSNNHHQETIPLLGITAEDKGTFAFDCPALIDSSVKCLMKKSDGPSTTTDNNKGTINTTDISKQPTNTISKNNDKHVIETSITTYKTNKKTDIKITEKETFTDSRLPMPFSTETLFQIFGSSSRLKNESAAIDNIKNKLVSKILQNDGISNKDILKKLDEILETIKEYNMFGFQKPKTPLKITSQLPQPVKKTSIPETCNKKLEISSDVKHSKESEMNSSKTSNVPDSKLPLAITVTPKVQKPKEEKQGLVENKALTVKSLVEKSNKPQKAKEGTSTYVTIKDNTEQKKVSTDASVNNYMRMLRSSKKKVNSKRLRKGFYEHKSLSKRDKKILKEILKGSSKKQKSTKGKLDKQISAKTIKDQKKTSGSKENNILPKTLSSIGLAALPTIPKEAETKLTSVQPENKGKGLDNQVSASTKSEVLPDVKSKITPNNNDITIYPKITNSNGNLKVDEQKAKESKGTLSYIKKKEVKESKSKEVTELVPVKKIETKETTNIELMKVKTPKKEDKSELSDERKKEITFSAENKQSIKNSEIENIRNTSSSQTEASVSSTTAKQTEIDNVSKHITLSKNQKSENEIKISRLNLKKINNVNRKINSIPKFPKTLINQKETKSVQNSPTANSNFYGPKSPKIQVSPLKVNKQNSAENKINTNIPKSQTPKKEIKSTVSNSQTTPSGFFTPKSPKKLKNDIKVSSPKSKNQIVPKSTIYSNITKSKTPSNKNEKKSNIPNSPTRDIINAPKSPKKTEQEYKVSFIESKNKDSTGNQIESEKEMKPQMTRDIFNPPISPKKITNSGSVKKVSSPKPKYKNLPVNTIDSNIPKSPKTQTSKKEIPLAVSSPLKTTFYPPKSPLKTHIVNEVKVSSPKTKYENLAENKIDNIPESAKTQKNQKEIQSADSSPLKATFYPPKSPLKTDVVNEVKVGSPKTKYENLQENKIDNIPESAKTQKNQNEIQSADSSPLKTTFYPPKSPLKTDTVNKVKAGSPKTNYENVAENKIDSNILVSPKAQTNQNEIQSAISNPLKTDTVNEFKAGSPKTNYENVAENKIDSNIPKSPIPQTNQKESKSILPKTESTFIAVKKPTENEIKMSPSKPENYDVTENKTFTNISTSKPQTNQKEIDTVSTLGITYPPKSPKKTDTQNKVNLSTEKYKKQDVPENSFKDPQKTQNIPKVGFSYPTKTEDMSKPASRKKKSEAKTAKQSKRLTTKTDIFQQKSTKPPQNISKLNLAKSTAIKASTTEISSNFSSPPKNKAADKFSSPKSTEIAKETKKELSDSGDRPTIETYVASKTYIQQPNYQMPQSSQTQKKKDVSSNQTTVNKKLTKTEIKDKKKTISSELYTPTITVIENKTSKSSLDAKQSKNQFETNLMRNVRKKIDTKNSINYRVKKTKIPPIKMPDRRKDFFPKKHVLKTNNLAEESNKKGGNQPVTKAFTTRRKTLENEVKQSNQPIIKRQGKQKNKTDKSLEPTSTGLNFKSYKIKEPNKAGSRPAGAQKSVQEESKDKRGKDKIEVQRNVQAEVQKSSKPLETKNLGESIEKLKENKNQTKLTEQNIKVENKEQKLKEANIESNEKIKPKYIKGSLGFNKGKDTHLIPQDSPEQIPFPMLLVDLDKMTKEIKPDLDLSNCHKCSVPLKQVTNYPLINSKKSGKYESPTAVLNVCPAKDPLLRKDLSLFPSVTKILNLTLPRQSRDVLREWRRSVIKDLGENGFKSFYKGQMARGSQFHNLIQDYLVWGEGGVVPSSPCFKSLHHVLTDITELSVVNSHVIHRPLAYRGVVDCVAKYNKKPVMIEFKRVDERSELGNSLETSYLQLSAYIGALNSDDNYKFQVKGGIIVVAYSDGSKADVISVTEDNCEKHWKEWLRRLQIYHSIFQKQNT